MEPSEDLNEDGEFEPPSSYPQIWDRWWKENHAQIEEIHDRNPMAKLYYQSLLESFYEQGRNEGMQQMSFAVMEYARMHDTREGDDRPTVQFLGED